MKQEFKYLTAMSVAMIALAGCSESDSADEPVMPAGNEIRFAAATEHSRAVETTTNTLKSFNVYAYTGTDEAPKLFMDNVTVNKSASNVWTYSPVQYWPAKETVDFYAYAPASWLGTSSPLSPVPFDAYMTSKDLIYAVSPNLSGNTGQANAQVIFNFRHALSKFTVKMRSSDPKLTVKVSNVGLSNIMTKGNFTFPKESTTDDIASGNVGTWTDQNTPMPYVIYWSQSPDELMTLTTTPTVITPDGFGTGESMFMLPQTLTWRSNGNGNDTYLTVMCSIYDAESGSKLWPNANTPEENRVEGSTYGDGLLKFALSTSKFSSWQPGVHYIYNLLINTNEDMGAIEFGTPTVDSFIEIETNYE